MGIVSYSTGGTIELPGEGVVDREEICRGSEDRMCGFRELRIEAASQTGAGVRSGRGARFREILPYNHTITRSSAGGESGSVGRIGSRNLRSEI